MMIVPYWNGAPISPEEFGPYIDVEFVKTTIDWNDKVPYKHVVESVKRCVIDDFPGVEGYTKENLENIF